MTGPVYRARIRPITAAQDEALDHDETGEDPCDVFRAKIECPVIEGE